MKTYNEITDKIDKLMFELLPEVRKTGNHELMECIAAQIDGLLWVIGDRSGAPTFDERDDLF